MRILQVIQYLSAAKGGSVTHVYNLTKYLTQRGHQVTIVTTQDGFDPEYAKSLAPAEVLSFPSKFGSLRYSPQMKSYLAEEIGRFDVIHLNNYWSYQNMIVAEYAGTYGIPYVLSPHGSLPIMMKSYLRKALFDALFGNAILRNASRVIAVCQMEADQALKKGVSSKRIKIIPNAIDHLNDIPMTKRAFRKKYGIAKEDKIILFLGRIHPVKGIDLLIRAFAGIADERNDVKLVIAGPDEGTLGMAQKMVCELKIEEKVLFPGPLYNEEKYEALIDSDIFVLPSRYEIFSIAILEAWSCSIPVIITDTQGLADYVRGKAGLVVPTEWQDLLNAMRKMLTDEQLRIEYGKTGRQLVEKYFVWNKVINLYENAYKEVRGEK
jgi:glycosyltransferase involved in cell wall biosynthesis